MKRPFFHLFFFLGFATIFAMPQIAHPQIITLIPNQVPNGIESGSGDQFHQRFNIQLGVAAVSQSRAFTITLPSEFTFVANSVTATSNLATLSAFFSGSPATDQLAFGLTGTASNQILTVEFDITTPTSFAGIAQGGAADTVYAFNFALGTNQSAAAVPVSKHQNKLIRLVSFTSPDSVSGDTTIGGGRLFKLEFPNALPDLSHTGLSGLSASQGITDSKTDVLYSFIASEDSTLVRYVAGDPLGFFSAQDVPPIRSSRQIPRIVPRTFIREDYTFTFADSLEGLAAVGELATERTFYIYVLADPATGRFPTRLQNGGNAKKGFDNTSLGAFSGRAFLGRSGPLLISHPPEFIAVGWDYDDDGGDDFNTTGVIQIPSDISGMASVDENRKDNRDIVVDSGSFFNKGSALPTLNNGRLPDPISSFDFLFFVEDTDNSQNFQMGIFLSTTGGLTEADLGGGISTLGDAILIPGSDTLTVNNQVFSFSPILRDQTTGLATSVFPEGEYFAYFVATDGDAAHRVVVPVLNDPFISNPTPAKITIKHSPLLMVDAFSINDFDGDGDLDVITGIDVSQMMTDLDGKDLLSGPAQRYVNIFWGGTLGREGDLDEDDSATIDLYFSTRSDFRDSRKSVAYTSGNSNGQDLLATVGVEDTHLIEAGIEEDGDELFDNNFAWDLWTYVSPEQTIPMTGVRYYLYALLKEAKPGGTERLVSFTDVGALQFQHPPYIRPIDPAQDLTVSMNEPVLISWEAVDVDNAETGGKSANPVGRGRIASNSRSDSPNIRILLTSADFGEVTTWGTLTNALNVHRSWLGNSGDGGLTEEIELNEGVDTTFVIIGHRIRNNLNRGGSSGDLALQTNLGVGETYFVYLAIDGGRDQTVGDLGGTAGDFSAFSPAVRAPGTITFTGTVPTNPPSVPRFFVPKEITVVENEVLHYPIIPDTLLGKTVGTVNIFLTADPNLFEAIDKDLTKDGIQPFTLEDITRTGVDPIHVDQRAYLQNGKLRLDFIFHDPITGLTKFNGQHVLATAHLRAKPLTDSSFVRTTLSLDNTGNRVTQILDKNVENLDALGGA
ncbi:MAG: hypothetical protein O7G87_17610, partial [bacterium]|nr:hypothetical protein [bacterium]